jgi:hypothetical protein
MFYISLTWDLSTAKPPNLPTWFVWACQQLAYTFETTTPLGHYLFYLGFFLFILTHDQSDHLTCF